MSKATTTGGRSFDTVAGVVETLSIASDGLPAAPRGEVLRRVSDQRLAEAIRRGDVYEAGGQVKVARVRV